MLNLIIRTLKLARLRFTCKRMAQPPTPAFTASRTFPSFTHTPPLCSVSRTPCVVRTEPGRNFLLIFRFVLPETPAQSRFLLPVELLRPSTCTTFLSLGSFHSSYPGHRRVFRGQIIPIHRGQRCAPAPAGHLTLPDVPQTMTLTQQTALRAAWIRGKCRTIQLIFI